MGFETIEIANPNSMQINIMFSTNNSIEFYIRINWIKLASAIQNQIVDYFHISVFDLFIIKLDKMGLRLSYRS